MLRLPASTFIFTLLLGLTVVTPFVAGLNLGPATPDRHARMIKRYSPIYNRVEARAGVLGNLVPSDSASGSSTNSVASQTPAASTSSTTDGGVLGSIGSALGSSSTSSTSSSTSTTSSQSSTHSTPPATSKDPSITHAPTSSNTGSLSSQTTLTSIFYTDGNGNINNATQQQIDDHEKEESSLSRIPQNVRIILIVIASVVAGLAVIWTAVRKWKFRSSRSFQDRLAPIDWQPDSDKDHAGAGANMSEPFADNVSVRRNMFSDQPNVSGVSLAPPAHDFTAGPRSASPLSYAARTPSPAPYARTASPNPGGYDASAYRGYQA